MISRSHIEEFYFTSWGFQITSSVTGSNPNSTRYLLSFWAPGHRPHLLRDYLMIRKEIDEALTTLIVIQIDIWTLTVYAARC